MASQIGTIFQLFPSRAATCQRNSQISGPRHYYDSISTKINNMESIATETGRKRGRVVASADTCQVAESLTVFSLTPDLDDEQISEVIDTCWSLQYMVRGPVCGSAGPVITGLVPSGTQSHKATSLEQFNNCILFRYASEKSMQDFLNHLKTKYMLDDVAKEKTSAGVATVTFMTSIPNELESIFRRGAEWEEGYELILGLDRSADGSTDDVEEFLRLTEGLASSSAFGAVQAAHGPVLSVINHTLQPEKEKECISCDDQFRCDTIFIARFPQDSSAVESFLQSPPMQAVIQADTRSPVSLAWGLIMEVSPGQSNESLN
ncbi:hypothetical protein PSENEW3n2_00000682 [Picochlorum sp. SENEW3]|nr:hypothetical protein PSENEW3n2_00000682 [Picochlorum sp. SENEW3]WPT15603.1 hypothetical protein PSENEW3_00000682 [Picochlorum sp. SENEW3]